MSTIFIYFTTHSPDMAFHIATTESPPIYRNDDLDKSMQRGIEPIVILGQLIADISGIEFEKLKVEETNIYPSGPEPSVEDWLEDRLPEDSPWHQGIYCNQLTNVVRDSLAGLSESSVKDFALQWSKIEEWFGAGDIDSLEQTVEDLSALAKRAQMTQKNLYVHYAV